MPSRSPCACVRVWPALDTPLHICSFRRRFHHDAAPLEHSVFAPPSTRSHRPCGVLGPLLRARLGASRLPINTPEPRHPFPPPPTRPPLHPVVTPLSASRNCFAWTILSRPSLLPVAPGATGCRYHLRVCRDRQEDPAHRPESIDPGDLPGADYSVRACSRKVRPDRQYDRCR